MHHSTLAKPVSIFLFLGIFVVYLYGLGHLPLLGPDEPRYAQVAREMFERRDFITPTLGGHTWFEKPALLYWMMIIAFKVFGVTEWSARLGPAICGLLTIAAVWYVGRQVESTADEGLRGFGFWSMLAAASCLGLIVFSHAASFDIVITMTTTLALSFFLLQELAKTQQGKNRLLVGYYAFVGLSLLAKGLVGLVVPFGVVGSYYLLRRTWPDRSTLLSLLWGIPLATAVAASWYGPVIARHGWSFIDEFFLQHHFARYTSNKYHHPQPIYFYPAIILMLTMPWSPFLIDALVRIRNWQTRSVDSLNIMRVGALAWLLMPIVFFSFSGSKLPGYILPGVPAASLLIADRITRLLSASHDYPRWSLIATGAICLTLGTGGLVYAWKSGDIPVFCAVIGAFPMFVAAAYTFAGSGRAAVATVTGATFVSILFVLECGALPIARRESVRDLLKLADARGYANVPVLAQRSDDRSAEFYASGRVVYGTDGEVIQIDEVTLTEARRRGKMLALARSQFLEHFRGQPGMEIIGNNGRTILIGWNPK